MLAAREFAAHVIDRTVTSEPVQVAALPSCGWPGGTATPSSAESAMDSSER